MFVHGSALPVVQVVGFGPSQQFPNCQNLDALESLAVGVLIVSGGEGVRPHLPAGFLQREQEGHLRIVLTGVEQPCQFADMVRRDFSTLHRHGDLEGLLRVRTVIGPDEAVKPAVRPLLFVLRGQGVNERQGPILELIPRGA